MLARMLLWHLDACGFAKEFDGCIDGLVSATIALYRELRDAWLGPQSQNCINVRSHSFLNTIFRIIVVNFTTWNMKRIYS